MAVCPNGSSPHVKNVQRRNRVAGMGETLAVGRAERKLARRLQCDMAPMKGQYSLWLRIHHILQQGKDGLSLLSSGKSQLGFCSQLWPLSRTRLVSLSKERAVCPICMAPLGLQEYTVLCSGHLIISRILRAWQGVQR